MHDKVSAKVRMLASQNIPSGVICNFTCTKTQNMQIALSSSALSSINIHTVLERIKLTAGMSRADWSGWDPEV